MKLKTVPAALAAILTLTACEDLFESGNLEPDGSVPSLTVNTPTNNQTASIGQGLTIDVTVVDKDQVSNLDFVVAGSSGENELIHFVTKPGKTVVEYDTLVSLQNFEPGKYTLLISAQDRRTNQSLKEVKFNVQ
ncbi:Ig-like domain-containing protein [Pontibacter ummariensis]|nr:Ig-like domain-containing protein [Pontibacter ummariensis]